MLDLGLVTADGSGEVSTQITSDRAVLRGENNVLLKSLVIHDSQDDQVKLGCCVIQPDRP